MFYFYVYNILATALFRPAFQALEPLPGTGHLSKAERNVQTDLLKRVLASSTHNKIQGAAHGH